MSVQTGDGELCWGISEGDELVVSTAVVDDHLHFVGAQRDVVGVNAEGGGGAVGHLPEATFGGNQTTHKNTRSCRLSWSSQLSDTSESLTSSLDSNCTINFYTQIFSISINLILLKDDRLVEQKYFYVSLLHRGW